MSRRKSKRNPNRQRRRTRARTAVVKQGLRNENTVQGVMDYLTLLGWYVFHLPIDKDPLQPADAERRGHKPNFPALYCEPPDPDRPPILIECRKAGKPCTSDQRRTHHELRRRGREVLVIDSVADLWEVHGIGPGRRA